MPDFVYVLAVLACPIVMGTMMLMMMRGGHSHQDHGDVTGEVARLRDEVERLRAERS